MSTVTPNWEVDFFIVATSTLDAHTDSLYANGRMQVPVTVILGAIDKSTSEPYNLTDEDIDKIQLYDADSTSKTLSVGWQAFNTRAPVFTNSLGISTASSDTQVVTPAKAQLLGATNSTFRSKTFWVATSTVGTSKIGALVRQPDNVIVTTQYSVYNAFVRLTSIEPIVYTTDNVSLNREDTADGSWNYYTQDPEEDGNWKVKAAHWDQDNYYLTSKVNQFVSADILGFDATGSSIDSHPADERLANIIGYWSGSGKTLRTSFVWDFGAETSKLVGLHKTGVIGGYGRAADAFVNMKVNNRANSVCLTRLAFDAPEAIWGTDWQEYDCTITVYDVYGNKGDFIVQFPSNHNLLGIKNAESA